MQLATQDHVVQAAVGTGVEDVREVRQRLVSIESGMVKMQRQEDKRGVDLLHKLSEQEVSLLAIPCYAITRRLHPPTCDQDWTIWCTCVAET